MVCYILQIVVVLVVVVIVMNRGSFIDTNGAERYAGSMSMLFGTRAVKTIGQIQEAVSGSPFSTLGKSYEVRRY